MPRPRPLVVLFALTLLGAGVRAAAPILLPELKGGPPGAGEAITLTNTAQLYVGDAEQLDWLGSARTLPAGPILVDQAQTFGKLRSVVARVAAGGASQVELAGGAADAVTTLAFGVHVGEFALAPHTLQVRVTPDAVFLQRAGASVWLEIKRKDNVRDVATFDALLNVDRSKNPAGTAAHLLVDDEVSWADGAAILQRLRDLGYGQVDVSWRPSQIPPRNAAAEAVSTGLVATRTFNIAPDGGFSWEGGDGKGEVEANAVRAWELDCKKKETCMLAAVDAEGKRYLAGKVTLAEDALERRFLFSRPVRAAVTDLPTGKPSKRTGELVAIAKVDVATTGSGFRFGVAPQSWVNVPAVADARPVVEAHAAVVRTAQGKLYFEGKEIAADALDSTLTAWRSTLSRGLLMLHLDVSTDAVTFLDLVDRARKAGFSRIGIAIRAKADGQLRGLVFSPPLTDANGPQTVHVRLGKGYVSLTRAKTLLARAPTEEPPNGRFLQAILAADLKTNGRGRAQLAVSADASLAGVVRALGALYAMEYESIGLIAVENASVGGVAAPTKTPNVPARLEVNIQGRYTMYPTKGEGTVVELVDQAAYYESCGASTCTMVLQKQDGTLWLVGDRPKTDDVLRGLVFGRPVSSWTGPKLPSTSPVREGDLLPVPRL